MYSLFVLIWMFFASILSGCAPPSLKEPLCSPSPIRFIEISSTHSSVTVSDAPQNGQDHQRRVLVTFHKINDLYPTRDFVISKTRSLGQFIDYYQEIGVAVIKLGNTSTVDPFQLAHALQDISIRAIEEDRGVDIATVPYCQTDFDPTTNNMPLGYAETGILRAKLHQDELNLSLPENQQIQLTGAGVKIGIIDSGIDNTHPDLVGRVMGGVNLVPVTENAIPDSESWHLDNLPNGGHGTKIAGIIGATANAFGITGIAPEAQLYALRSKGRIGSSAAWSVRALYWARTHNLDIVNISGALRDGARYDAYENEINEAVKQGMIIVAASGNSNNNVPQYPASYKDVISVANVYPQSPFLLGRDSSFNRFVDIAAPGMGLLTTNSTQEQVSTQSLTPYGSYSCASGTSIAAPYVTGIIALLKQKFPHWNSRRLQRQLVCNARDIGTAGFDEETGYGLVDADAALFHDINEEQCHYLQSDNLPLSQIVGSGADQPQGLTEPTAEDLIVKSFFATRFSVADNDTMNEGLLVSARITDHRGQPIEGATLEVQLDDPQAVHGNTSTPLAVGHLLTGANGNAQAVIAGPRCGSPRLRVTSVQKNRYRFLRTTRGSVTVTSFDFRT